MAISLETLISSRESPAQDNPLVSICIPTYNRAGMIGKAIDSALNQSYSNIEVIVVDNASSDNTESVIAAYQDNRLRYIKNQTNLGLFGNFNRCVDLASGKYIHILHSDDFIDPDFTKTCIQFMEAHHNVVMTFGPVRVLNNGKEKRVGSFHENRIFPAPEGFKQLLANRNMINCPTVILRREVYDEIGRYSPEYPYAADLHLWLAISKRFDIAYLDALTLFYQQGEHSESYHSLFTNVTGYIDVLKIHANLISSLGAERNRFNSEINSSLRRFALDCIFAGYTRIENMPGFGSSFFTSLAISAWSMIGPQSIIGQLCKLGLLIIILCSNCIMGIGPLRRLVKRFLLARTTTY